MSFAKILAIAAVLAIAGSLIVYRTKILSSKGKHPSLEIQKFSRQIMEPGKENIILKTLDGLSIAGTLYRALDPKGAVVFVHMMPATKESWAALAESFAAKGFVGLSIDLRGHGDSSGGPKAYTKFSDEEHEKSILDLDAAAKFLLGQGFTAGQIACVGASIGANLCFKYIVDHPEFKIAALLSGGLDYRGIKIAPLAKSLKEGARVLLISSKDDDSNSADNEALFAEIPEAVGKHLRVYESGGHGTELLKTQAELPKLLFSFITHE